MTKMSVKLVEILLLVVSLLKELLALALEGEPLLSQSLQLIWKGFLGGSTWFGFAMYALYALGLDYGFATEVCEAIGYLYLVINELSVIVSFAQSAEEDSSASA